jgi:hypothetical protein
MDLGNVFGKTHITKRSASARITVVAFHPVVFELSYLYIPKGGTRAKMIGEMLERNKTQ